MPFQVTFRSAGLTFGGAHVIGSVGLAGATGPDSVRINWDSAGPDGTLPVVETYLPDPVTGGFNMPFDTRPYLDGAYTVRTVATTAGVIERVNLTLFFDNNGQDGVNRVGTGLNDFMQGGVGNDTFRGGAGQDWLSGGQRDDIVNAGAGNDLVAGDDGNDTLLGGEGDDLVVGGNDDDLARGGDGSDGMFGDTGNDTLLGEGGDDFIEGGEGDDLLNGGAGDDALFGGEGNDTLLAGTGTERLDGGAGRDRLRGDTLGEFTGFVYNDASEGGDVIVRFEQNIDELVLNFIQQTDIGPGDLVGSFNDMTDNGIWLIFDASNSYLFVDMNGTDAGGRAVVARLVGLTSFDFNDFVFADQGS